MNYPGVNNRYGVRTVILCGGAEALRQARRERYNFKRYLYRQKLHVKQQQAENSRRWRAANKERDHERKMRWQRANKDRYNALRRRRYALRGTR